MPPALITAADVARGSCRLLWQQGYTPLTEVTLADGHRADIMAISSCGEILIVEIKVAAADLRQDRKWPHYRAWCDRFLWAVPDFLARELDAPRFLPDACGLIVADRHDGLLVRAAAATPLPAMRRKALTVALARQAMRRLHRSADPSFDGWGMADAPGVRS